MTTSLRKHRTLRIVGRQFVCAVALRNGRITKDGTAPYLKRLAGITEAALLTMAAARGWKVEDVRG